MTQGQHQHQFNFKSDFVASGSFLVGKEHFTVHGVQTEPS